MRRFTLPWTVFSGGAVLMALEILASRFLAPQFGNSVYVWGSIISVFLAALSAGYYLGGYLADRRPDLGGLVWMVLLCAASVGLLLVTGPWLVSVMGDLTRGTPWGTLVTAAALFMPSSVLLATLSPYAIRLAARDLEHLGGTAGRLYAVSTAGSLVGTVGCTFGLIPFLDLTASLVVLLSVISATVLVPALAADRAARLPVALAAGLFLAALAGRIEPARPPGVIFDRMTPYQTLRVHDGAGTRYLESDRVLHGAIFTADGETALNYNRILPAALLFQPEMERMLVIGMGSGAVGRYFQDRLPGLGVDMVDVDPAVPEVARQFMRFRDGPGMRVHVADGRRFLLESDERWDLVFVDAYIGLTVPFHLTTREFVALARSHLAPDGVFALNLASDLSSPFSRAMVRTVADVFPEIAAFRVPGLGNLIVFAGASGIALRPEELGRRAQEIDARASDGKAFDPPLSRVVELRYRGEMDLSGAQVLSDRFAPVDRLIHLQGDVPEPALSSAADPSVSADAPAALVAPGTGE